MTLHEFIEAMQMNWQAESLKDSYERAREIAKRRLEESGDSLWLKILSDIDIAYEYLKDTPGYFSFKKFIIERIYHYANEESEE